MKKTLLTICVILFALPTWGETLTVDDLVERNEIYFKKFTNKPFTGLSETYYQSGQLKEVGGIVDGKKNGLWKAYYQNGQLDLVVTWVNGKRHGITKGYFEKSGNLQLIERYSNGKLNGKFETYYENGNISIIQYYQNGFAYKTCF